MGKNMKRTVSFFALAAFIFILNKSCIAANYGPQEDGLYAQFQENPKAFTACLFCRMPVIKHASQVIPDSCLLCVEKVQKLMIKKLNHIVHIDEQNLSNIVWGVIRDADKSEKFEIVAPFADYAEKQTAKLYDQKAHIYAGCLTENGGKIKHVWVKNFKIPEELKEGPLSDQSYNDWVRQIIQKSGICGPKTGHVLQKKPKDISTQYITEAPLSNIKGAKCYIIR